MYHIKLKETMEEVKGNPQDSKMKKIVYMLVAVAIVLAAALAFVWFERTSLVNDLNDEKQDLTQRMIELQNDYASLSSDY